MKVTPKYDELLTLLSGFVDDTLSDADMQQLDDWLQRDEQARTIYVHYMSMQLDLTEQADAAASLEDTIPVMEPQACRPALLVGRPLALAAAAVLMIGVFVGMLVRGPSVPMAQTEKTDNGVAVISRLAMPLPDGGADVPALLVGDIVEPGRFTIVDGVAELEFYRGARVAVQGPADLEILTDNSIRLDEGVIRAHVPPEAHGFTIIAPDAEIIDRGTEFGVVVLTGEPTRVRVYDGRVDVVAAETLSVESGSGVTVGDDRTLRPWDGTDDPVLSAQALELAVQADVSTRRQRLALARATLANDERAVLYYSMQDLGNHSRRVANEAADGASDGILVGCTTAPGPLPGTKSLRFEGVADRVRCEVKGEFPALTVAGWFHIASLNNTYTGLLMSDGYEYGEMHWQIRDDGHVRLGVQYEPLEGANYISSQALTAEAMGRWIHLAFTYDTDAGIVRHYIDGELVAEESMEERVPLRIGRAEIGNWSPEVHQTGKPARGFAGRIGEFVVLSAALSPDEVAKLYRSGRGD